jgi:DNA helicase-2/ATP-dependent DNA helicase PcrA
MSKNWSAYQLNVFSFIENETGNAVIEAVAGSGKSTTIIEGVNRIPFGATSLFLAFNKAIAEELKEKGVNARTFHSLTYNVTLKHKGSRTVEMNKMNVLAKEMMTWEDFQMYGSFCIKLVGAAKGVGIGCLVDDTEENWYNIIDHHDMELDHELALMQTAVSYSRQLLEMSNKSTMVDFDDMLYIPVKDGLKLDKYDFVFVDEVQDLNPIQRAMLKKIMHEKSRLIAVGDPAQAIYGFRGADNDSLHIVAREFNCKTLPLTISYRCAKDVVRFAHTWVSHIEAATTAPEGQVQHRDTKWAIKEFESTDLVVCRTNKPIVNLAYQLIKNRIPAKILGREIGQGLTSLIKKMNAKDIDSLVEKLEVYREREVQKALVQDKEHKIQTIEDKVDSILVLIEALEETNRTVPALVAIIESLFNNNADAVTLCSIHKSKGLEAKRVWWLNPSQCPSKYAKKPWQQQQERNLCYVAATRAKTDLILIEEPKKK